MYWKKNSIIEENILLSILNTNSNNIPGDNILKKYQESWPSGAVVQVRDWRSNICDVIWYTFCTKKGINAYEGGEWILIEPELLLI